MGERKALIVMAKRPIPGKSKTRLLPLLTAEEAAGLYESFLLDSLQLAKKAALVAPHVAYTPVDQESAAYFEQIAPDFGRIAQVGSTLGERLYTVLAGCLERGYEQVVAMNSDSPLLPVQYLEAAFQRLDNPQVDVVLGPCTDGGYYLIGWKEPHARLVQDVVMSTDHVLADTLKIAAADQLQVALLEAWYDIDDAADLERLRTELERSDGAEHTRRFLEAHLKKTVRDLER